MKRMYRVVTTLHHYVLAESLKEALETVELREQVDLGHVVDMDVSEVRHADAVAPELLGNRPLRPGATKCDDRSVEEHLEAMAAERGEAET